MPPSAREIPGRQQPPAHRVPKGWGLVAHQALSARVGKPGAGLGTGLSAYLSARLQKSRMAGMAACPEFAQGAGGDLGVPGQQAEPPVPVLVGSRRQPGSNVMTTRNESSPPRAPTRTARLPLPTDSPTGVLAPAWGWG